MAETLSLNPVVLSKQLGQEKGTLYFNIFYPVLPQTSTIFVNQPNRICIHPE